MKDSEPNAHTIQIKNSEDVEVIGNVDMSGRPFLDADRVSRMRVLGNVIGGTPKRRKITIFISIISIVSIVVGIVSIIL